MTTQFTKLFSFILANVHDPAQVDESGETLNRFKATSATASRLSCYSCMSPYLEHQYMYISHLYRRPLGFTEKCDQANFDARYVKWKNCTDMCVTVRMNDRLGGRRREGYLRGCMSDILHYNQTIAHLSSSHFCAVVRMRDLFVSTERYLFEPSDHVQLCTCHTGLCNSAIKHISLHFLLFLIFSHLVRL